MKPKPFGPERVSIRQLRAFISVAETGSFTDAAKMMNLTQPAISVLVADLERELELKLFDRTSRSVSLTDAGSELLGSATRALVDLQAAITSSRELSNIRRGRVRIAATPLFASLILPPAILEFSKRFPGVDIVIRDTASHLVHTLVEDGQVELGIDAARDQVSPFVWDLLPMDEILLACRPDHAFATKDYISWHDLQDIPYIAVTPESVTRRIVDAYMREEQVSVKPAFEVSSIWTLLGLVGCGLGVGFTTAYARLLTGLYDVKLVRVGDRRIDRPIGLVRHESRSLPPAAIELRKFLRQWMSDNHR